MRVACCEFLQSQLHPTNYGLNTGQVSQFIANDTITVLSKDEIRPTDSNVIDTAGIRQEAADAPPRRQPTKSLFTAKVSGLMDVEETANFEKEEPRMPVPEGGLQASACAGGKPSECWS